MASISYKVCIFPVSGESDESRPPVAQKALPIQIEGVVVRDDNVGMGPEENSNDVERVNDACKGSQTDLGSTQAEAARIRAARAKLIEETTYRLTDLFTIISGRIEILSEKVPEICRQELLAIRSVLMRGVELNDRLYLLAQACRREIGRPLNSAEIMDE